MGSAFTDTRAFQTKAEIRAYLAEDTLACLLCGSRLTVLGPHLRARHGMDADAYRARFGIPQNCGLAGRGFRQGAQARMRSMHADGTIVRPDAETARSRLTGKRRRRQTPAVRRADTEKLLAVHGRDSQWTRADFEEFIHRVERGRTVTAVGLDTDMPSRQTLFKYLARNPDVRARYERARQSQPLSVQVATHRAGPLYHQTVIRLRGAGLTWAEIAAATGIKSSTLRNAWRTLRPESA